MGQKYFSTLPLWHTPEKPTYSWKKYSTYNPHLGLEEIPTEKLKPGSNVPKIH